MADVRKPVAQDWDRWTGNIEAFSNWDGTVSLFSACPAGRKSCAPNPRPPYDVCAYFMGVKDSGKGCCGYLLNEKEES